MLNGARATLHFELCVEKWRVEAANMLSEHVANLDALIREELARFDFEAALREAVRSKLKILLDQEAQQIAWGKANELREQFRKQVRQASIERGATVRCKYSSSKPGSPMVGAVYEVIAVAVYDTEKGTSKKLRIRGESFVGRWFDCEDFEPLA